MKTLSQAARLLLVLTLLGGVIYPLVVTAIASIVAPVQAQGDLTLIGRSWTDPRDFWGRPSATAERPYNASASSGSNLGPLSEALATAVKERVSALHSAGDVGDPPVDLVTASASGLDPHISPAAAHYQAARVATRRGLPIGRIAALIEASIEPPMFGILGAARVNVLALNQHLEALQTPHGEPQ